MTPTTDPSLFGLLRSAAARYGARPALAQRGLLRYARWSYADLLERAEQAVAALAAHGVRPGDRVLTCAPNSPALVAAYFGVWRAGAILVPLDPRTPPAVAARVAARVAPRLLITDGRRHGLDAPGLALPTLRSLALADLWAAPASPGQEQVADDADGAAAVAALPPGVTLREVAEIVFTSGTTGEPRGVVLTHANVLASVRAGRRVLPLRPGDAVLSLLPLSHMLEQTAGLLVPLARGAQIVYPASRQPQAVLRALRDNRVAAVVAVPQVLDLLRRAVEREADGSSALAWRVARRLSSVLPWPARRVLFGPLHAALGGRLATFLCGGGAAAAGAPGLLGAARRARGPGLRRHRVRARRHEQQPRPPGPRQRGAAAAGRRRAPGARRGDPRARPERDAGLLGRSGRYGRGAGRRLVP